MKSFVVVVSGVLVLSLLLADLDAPDASAWVPRVGEPSCTAEAEAEPAGISSGQFEGLEAVLVADGLDEPVDMAQLPGWEDLFLVAEKPGRILAIRDGEVLTPPVLDISDIVSDDVNERGLITIEPHPDFAENCELFMFYTDVDGHSNLVSAWVSGTDVPSVDLDTMRTHLFVEQHQKYHQSGSMFFGPDDVLWVSIGDGGLGNEERSQDPRDINGSVIRIDVGAPPYRIPEGNAFTGTSSLGGAAEIWAMGLRNPWRISLDVESGYVFIPDIGLSTAEELNIVPLAEPGLNFGWPITEGNECLEVPACDTAAFEPPDLHMGKSEICAMVGGEVYRGPAIPELNGHYFFGDFCRAWVRSLTFEDGEVVEVFEWPQLDMGSSLTSIISDRQGELYFTSLEGGLWKIVPVREDA